MRAIAFDKTGTLTRGEPIVVGGGATSNDVDVLPDRCLAYQGLLARGGSGGSPHPWPGRWWPSERLGLGDGPAAEDVQSEPGRGIHGTVDGHQVMVGSHATSPTARRAATATFANAWRRRRGTGDDHGGRPLLRRG